LSVQPLQYDHSMSHGHKVGNCSLRYCKNSRQFNLDNSRSPAQCLLQNQRWHAVNAENVHMHSVCGWFWYSCQWWLWWNCWWWWWWYQMHLVKCIGQMNFNHKASTDVGLLLTRACRIPEFNWPKHFSGYATPKQNPHPYVLLWSRLLSILSCRLSIELSSWLSIRLSSTLRSGHVRFSQWVSEAAKPNGSKNSLWVLDCQ